MLHRLEAARGRVWDRGVRRQLHVLGERGVRAAGRVPLPPWLLRGQLRHQVPAPVLGSRLQGAVCLPPARAVRGRDGTVYVSRAALGRTLRACVPVPARRVPSAERRVSLRAWLVGRTVRQRVLLQCHVALRPTDGRVPVPLRLVGPQLQQSVRLQLVAVRATKRPLPVPRAHVRRALRALLPVLPWPLPPGGRHVLV